MFSAISWSDYLTILLVSAIFYYAFVLYFFYRNDLLQFFKKKQVATNDMAGFDVGNHDTELANMVKESYPTLIPTTQSHPGYSPIVQSLIDEVQAFVEEVGKNKFSKEQILSSVTYLINKYPSVKLSPFKKSISDLIIEECKTHCSVTITEDEVNGLWEEE
jgi:hypothetical protein